MKKTLAVLLLAVLALSVVSAAAIGEQSKGMKKIVILNNAFDGLELTDQCYNAKEYHKSYNLGEIIDDNFWFAPAADCEAKTVAFTDFYTDSTSLDIFRQKFVSFVKDNDGNYDYDIFVGKQQKESYDVQYKGYCIIDKEALVFVPEDGWAVKDLFDNIGISVASAYKFVSVSGESMILAAADLANASIALHEDNCADLVVGDKTLEAVQYVTPDGLTANSAPAADGLSRLTFLLCAKGVYKTDAPYLANRAGTYYPSWSVAELFAKYDITPCDQVNVISTDGYSQKEDYSLFAQKYIAFQAPTAKGDQKDFFTLGQVQKRNTGVYNVAYYVLEKEAFAYIPTTGIAVGDFFAATGFEAGLCKLTFADGTEKVMRTDVAAKMILPGDSLLEKIEVFF